MGADIVAVRGDAMARICLINPPWIIQRGTIWRGIRPVLPPLGLLYLAAVLEQERIPVDVLDFQAPRSASWPEIEKRLAGNAYDYYGITATTPIVAHAYRIAAMIKKNHPQAQVIMGGVHVTALPEEALARPDIAYVIRGEAENALPRLLRGEPAKTISGISFREGSGIRHIGPDGIMPELDRIPFPAFHKINISSYRPAFAAYRCLPAVNMLTTRGCPGHCAFCNSAGIPLRTRSAENIFAEITQLYHALGIREIQFYDDTFTVYAQNVERLCDLLICEKLPIVWCCFARADCVYEHLLKKMKLAGCHQILYGVEAADPEILQGIGKHIDPARTKKAVAMTKSAGITTRCAFMLGSPGETAASIARTIRYAIELDPDIALYNITTPYPGTRMFTWAKKNGWLLTEQWQAYDLGNPVLRLEALSARAVKRAYRRAYAAFYLRPRYMIQLLRRNFSLAGVRRLCAGMKKILRLVS